MKREENVEKGNKDPKIDNLLFSRNIDCSIQISILARPSAILIFSKKKKKKKEETVVNSILLVEWNKVAEKAVECHLKWID